MNTRPCLNIVNLRSFFVGVMPLSELRKLEIHSFALFSYMLLHIELKLYITFLSIYFRSSSSIVNMRQLTY